MYSNGQVHGEVLGRGVGNGMNELEYLQLSHSHILSWQDGEQALKRHFTQTHAYCQSRHSSCLGQHRAEHATSHRCTTATRQSDSNHAKPHLDHERHLLLTTRMCVGGSLFLQ